MKKNLSLILLLTALFSVNSFAQFKLGPMGGLNLSNIKGDDSDDDGSLIGFHLGAVGDLDITDLFGVQAQLLFSTQGTKSKSTDLKFKCNYLKLPVLARVRLDNGVTFLGGPYFGFLLSAKVDDFDVKDQMNGTDFGLKFGAGYTAEQGYGATLNCDLGLSNIIADNAGSNHHLVFALSLFYLFALGGE